MLIVCCIMLLSTCSGASEQATTTTDHSNSNVSALAEENPAPSETPTGQEKEETETTATPGASPTSRLPDVALADEQAVSQKGYPFRPVEGWTVETQSGIAVLRPSNVDPNEGPTIVLTLGPLDTLNIDGVSSDSIESLDDLCEALTKSLEQESPGIALETAHTIDIETLPGCMVRFESTGFADIETAVAGQIAGALPDNERAFVMFGLATPPERYQTEAEFAAVLASVRFLEASQSEAPTATATVTPPPVEE
jgi:hypothetical protein